MKSKLLINTKLQLVAPLQFKVIKEKIGTVPKNYAVVKPTLLSICNADLRYYSGKRRKEDLMKKLPMSLIHEGVGKIVSSNKFKEGDRVVIVPNIPCYIQNNGDPCEICKSVGENYCPNAKFLSSGFDGFTQSYLVHPESCLVKIPEKVPDEIAVFSELMSVAHNLINRLNIAPHSKIVIFGDGPIGYIFSLLLSYLRKDSNIHVIGKYKTKLDNFDFVKTLESDNPLLESRVKDCDFVFECVGESKSADVINKGIQIVKPGGTIVLVGVSEEYVSIDTRNILAKGLTLRGTSRSEIKDFVAVMQFLEDDYIQSKLTKLSNKIFECKNINDLVKIFDIALDKSKHWGKILFRASF
jgi:ribitol-5-phosphate 2-dehydrogenase